MSQTTPSNQNWLKRSWRSFFVRLSQIFERQEGITKKAKTSWIGTISNVDHELEPEGQRSGRREQYKFVLLQTEKKADGSEERFEKSVEIHGRKIPGGVFNGRQVVVEGKEGKDGWIHATVIIDAETGAVTGQKRSEILWIMRNRIWIVLIMVILISLSISIWLYSNPRIINTILSSFRSIGDNNPPIPNIKPTFIHTFPEIIITPKP